MSSLLRLSTFLAAILLALSLGEAAALQPQAAAGIGAPERSPFSLPAAYRPEGSLPALGNRAFILCWHTFLGRPDISTDFSLAELSSQVDALISLGYRFISLEDLIFGRFSGCRNLVATLDDGHRTVSSAYTKVFAARGITPALFIYPSVIGSTSYSLNPEQLQALSDSGCLVGAHGYYHLYVTESLYKSDRAAFEKEIFTAKSRVETMTRLPVYVYAYPFGAFSPITRQEVERAGYAYAFAVKRGFVFADPRLNDPFELPRSVVTRENWAELYAFLARNAAK